MKAIFFLVLISLPLHFHGQSRSQIYNEGLTHFRAGNYEIAIDRFEELVEQDAYHYEAVFYLGRCHFHLDNRTEALKHFSDVIDMEPDFYPAWFYRGRVHHGNENYQSALNDYNEAARINPDLAVAYLERARIYDRKDMRSQALENYNKNEELAGGSYQLYYNRAVLLNKMGHLDQALRDALRAIDYQPHRAEPFILRSRIFRRQNKMKQAEQELNNYLSVNEQSDKAYTERADLYFDRGEYQKALEDYEVLTSRFDNRDIHALYRQGVCYARVGNQMRARRAFTRVISQDRNHADAYAQRAFVYLDMNQESRAQQDLRTALRLDENNPIAWFLLGKIQAGTHDYEEALESLNNALEQEKNGEAYALRAHCKFRLKDAEGACQDIKMAIMFGYDREESLRKMEKYCK